MPYLLAYKAPPVMGDHTRMFPDVPESLSTNPSHSCPNPLREVLKNLLMLEYYMNEKEPCVSGIIKHAMLVEGFCEASLALGQSNHVDNVLQILLKYCRKLTSDISNSGYTPGSSRWLPEDVKAVYGFLHKKLMSN